MKPGLGTQLRHLIELLDGDVAQTYANAGLDYRPRFTPVMRVLQEHDTLLVGRFVGRGRATTLGQSDAPWASDPG